MGLTNSERFMKSLEIYRKCTKETWLLAMQVKIIHNILATNKRKQDWGIQDFSNCQYCQTLDTILHYIWHCPFTQQVIKKCLNVLNINNIDFSMWDFIFGKDDIMIDNLSLMIKNYIYTLRKEDKQFSNQQFLYEVDVRFKADMTENNRENYKYAHKWSFFKDMAT